MYKLKSVYDRIRKGRISFIVHNNLTNIILKKGGRAKEPFIADKIRMSLERAANDAGLTDSIAAVSYTHLTLPTNREV